MNKEKKNKTAEEEIRREEPPQEPQTTGCADEKSEQPASSEESRTDVAAEAEELLKKNEELSDRLMRTMAEFDNFKKRTAREKQEIGSFAKGACIKELLGVADNFERALSTECKDEDFYKGMEMILKQMQDTFTRLGATEIEALNMPFNPEMHHAIKQVEDESFGENTVCQVLQKGYTLDGHVIRHALVVVANP